jgi:hypothetical protein
VFSNLAARVLFLQADDGGRSLSLALTNLTSTEVVHATVFGNEPSAPLSYRLSIANLVKTKTLSQSVLDDKGAEFVKLVGEQPYDTVQREIGPIFEHHKQFNDFLDAMDNVQSRYAAIPGWCIPLFCIPILGIATFAIKRCRS